MHRSVAGVACAAPVAAVTTSLLMYKRAMASLQGPSHRRADPPVPCQDAGFTDTLPNGMVAIVVSDGAGSSRLSHLASQHCVNTLFSLLQRADLDADTRT